MPDMQICCRCGRKGELGRLSIEVTKGPDAGKGWLIDQKFHLCDDCTSAVLDNLSVILSNETWVGDGTRGE
jgi:hypothetical protein